VVNEVKTLVEQGFYDFSFISQDSSSYLRDLDIQDGLSYLVDRIEEIKGVKSARILYLYPSTLSLEVLGKIMQSKIFHNYFDMPIQHISENMLRIMKRGAGTEVVKAQLNFMRSAKNSFVRTSIIVGHPGESDEDFDELCQFLKDYNFDRINIFAYSDEEGTKASGMDDLKIDKDVIDKRIKELDEIVKKCQTKSLEMDLDKECEVIVLGESSEGEHFFGARKLSWAEDIDGEILINESECEVEIGKVYIAKISENLGDKLLGSILRSA
jgi:tRNA A37 methylthiotransferase MiaB